MSAPSSRLNKGMQKITYKHWTKDKVLEITGTLPTRLNNNCSGKHTGFLTTALHLNEPVDGYLDPTHPVQKRLYDILTLLGGQDLADTGRGVDGCGIPIYGMTLTALATAAQKFAAPNGLGDARGKAVQRILEAAMAEPFMIAGPGRFDTDIMTALAGRVATKGGAEGVHIAIIPEKGLGIALKTEDGERRAGDVAMCKLLIDAGMISGDDAKRLQALIRPDITNAAGDKVGYIRIKE